MCYLKELLYFAFAALLSIRTWNIQFESLNLKILDDFLNYQRIMCLFFLWPRTLQYCKSAKEQAN